MSKSYTITLDDIQDGVYDHKLPQTIYDVICTPESEEGKVIISELLGRQAAIDVHLALSAVEGAMGKKPISINNEIHNLPYTNEFAQTWLACCEEIYPFPNDRARYQRSAMEMAEIGSPLKKLAQAAYIESTREAEAREYAWTSIGFYPSF